MRKFGISGCAVISLFMMNLALASDVQFDTMGAGDAGKDGKGGVSQPAASISLDEFRDRCLHPKTYPQQLEPEQIRIQCAETHTEYVPAAAGVVPLESNRTVVASLIASKYFVAAGAVSVPVAQKGGSCMRYKEVEKSVAMDRPLTCDDVTTMKMDIGQYCTSLLDATKASNPKLTQIRDTGRVIDTCGGIAGVPGKSGQK